MRTERTERRQGIIAAGLEILPEDRRIWESELADFVPTNIIDIHAHLWKDAFATQNTPDTDWRRYETDFADLTRATTAIFPGRMVSFMAFALPLPHVDFDGINHWVVNEVTSDNESVAAAFVSPCLSTSSVANLVESYPRFLALKPYPTLTRVTGGAIASFFPEHQMEVAEALELVVVLHLPLGPEPALPELEVFCRKYPRIRWLLAHAAGLFNRVPQAQTVEHLADLPNIWYDTSGVSNAEVYTLLFERERVERILYGTDNAIGIGGLRRERQLKEDNGPGCLRCYLQLRGMKDACRRLGLSPEAIDGIFKANAVRMLSGAGTFEKRSKR